MCFVVCFFASAIEFVMVLLLVRRLNLFAGLVSDLACCLNAVLVFVCVLSCCVCVGVCVCVSSVLESWS